MKGNKHMKRIMKFTYSQNTNRKRGVSALPVNGVPGYLFASCKRRPTRKAAEDIFCFSSRLVLGLFCWLSALFVANNAHAAFGDILAQYTFPASSLVMSPTEEVMYATIPSQNSIAIINANTLVVETTVFVGSGPANVAFSPDGLRAYIANSSSNFVAVFDTQSRMVVDSFLLSEQPQDVVFGSLNRLWVLGQTQIFQIDATTGASTGPSIGFVVYLGALEISPDRNTLYYADYELSPATMYKYDVSTYHSGSRVADAVRDGRKQRPGFSSEPQWQLYLLCNRLGAEWLPDRKVQNFGLRHGRFFQHWCVP